jgi:predicted RNA-binding Zn-ribbon protein involved in translation (DUF1610 family)
MGSGRTGGKPCTDDMRRIDVRRLAREGYLKPGMAFGWHWSRLGEVIASVNITVQDERIWLDYRQRERGGQWQNIRYPVQIDRTPCHFGRSRVWWRCPVVGCGRRVAILHGGTVFACRQCHRLAYRCQRERPDDRATRRADKLRDRLGWEPGILNGEGDKPKWMHWRTFERLRADHDASVNASLAGVMQRFGWAADV